MTTETTTRPIYTIANEIGLDWKNPYFGAVPYLRAMHSLRNVTDAYGYDDGRSIIMYFLANANTWRGETARRVKAELKALLKESARR
jgi:hypothetical protein